MPHAIGVKGESVLSMAGLWETWSGDGHELHSVAVVTTEANDVVAPVPDRMPAVLDPDEEDRWLEADDPAELRSMLDPFPADRTRRHEVSPAVNDPSREGPELVEPVGSDQASLDGFG